MPAPPLLAHEPVLLKGGQDAIEVVLLDADRLRDLGDGDAGARAHELERLLGARAAAARPSAAPGAGRGGAARATSATRGCGGGGGAAAGRGGHAFERGRGGLEAVELVDEGAQLIQPR